MTREKELVCTLLWLRNHYDCSVPDEENILKKNVMARVDREINKDPPSITDMTEWRVDYLRGDD